MAWYSRASLVRISTTRSKARQTGLDELFPDGDRFVHLNHAEMTLGQAMLIIRRAGAFRQQRLVQLQPFGAGLSFFRPVAELLVEMCQPQIACGQLRAQA